jgi:hypothetical protein
LRRNRKVSGMSQSAQFQSERTAGSLLRVPAPVLIAAALLIVELSAILTLGDGRFSYTLDDAYIHLAVSEEIARGGYGINQGEFAAPASSILWPFLLAPFAEFEWHPFVPLILNFGFVLGCAWILCELTGLELGGGSTPGLRNLLPVLPLLGANIVPVAFTGMEHVLHAWLSLAAVLGAALFAREGQARWWLWPALGLAPLIRYEALGLTLPLAVLLWNAGCRRQVAVTITALGLSLLSFSAVLLWHGLPPLPSSVMSKAGIAGPDLALAASFLSRIREQFEVREFWTLTILAGALTAVAIALPSLGRLALALVCATILHLIFGVTRGGGRYEAYILLSDLSFLAMLMAPRLAALGRRRGIIVMLLAGVLLLTPLWPRTMFRLTATPLAADNIASLQREMRRFATEFWLGPIAVNDIGWVAYRNDAYVLDLWGLGYEEARRKRMGGEQGWAEELMRRRDVSLMMVFDGWLGREVPPGWVPIGRLVLTRKRLATPESEVGFYARPDRAHEIAELARGFAAGLPAGAEFRFAQ